MFGDSCKINDEYTTMRDEESTVRHPTGRKPEGKLRKGWTTGACATAAASAAYQALLNGQFPDPVTIHLPNGMTPSFTLSTSHIAPDGTATAGIIKDAGDDPDVTHGAEILASVRLNSEGSGIRFFAGEGVGTVTLPGLPLKVGEPAINPKPREMITENLMRAAGRPSPLDVDVTISVPGGDKLAAKTMNGRLGIVGGLSILGTTGIVIPYSCASWIHSIHRGIDVARAGGITHIAASTGSTSESAVQALYDLPETALIDMGDFVGGTLKYLRNHPVEYVTIAGGFGKLAKLAQGEMDLHSSRSRVNMENLAKQARSLGAPETVIEGIKNANTAMEALAHARQNDLPLADRIASQAKEVALATLSGGVHLNIAVFDRQGVLVANSDDPIP